MMNHILFALILLSFLFSCGKRENAWDELTPAEQNAVRARVEAKCRNNAEGWMKAFTKESNLEMLTDKNFERGYVYQHKLTEGTDNWYTTDVYYFKQDKIGNALYLLIRKTESKNASWYFLKITPDDNEDMISSLRDQLCDERISVSGSTSLTVTKDDISSGRSNGDNFYFYNDTYKLSFDEPAYFGLAFKRTRVEEERDEDGKVIKTKTYKSTWEKPSVKFVEDPELIGNQLDLDGDGNTTDNNEIGLVFYYCTLGSTYTLPFDVDEKTCAKNSDGLPAGWDLSI